MDIRIDVTESDVKINGSAVRLITVLWRYLRQTGEKISLEEQI